MSPERTAAASIRPALGGRVSPALLGQIVRFGIVGVSNTLLSLLLFWVGFHLLGIWYPAASVGAFFVGAVNSYTLNRLWTFRAGASSRTRFARYLIVQLICVGINLGVLVALVQGLSVPHLLAQVAALIAVSATGFVLNRQWAFAAPPAA